MDYPSAFRPLLLLVAMLLWQAVLPAQDLYWIGGNGLWSSVNSWSFSPGGPACACTPNTGDDVVISSGSGTIRCLISGVASARSVTIEAGTSLEIGDLSIFGNKAVLTIDNPTSGTGITVNGTLEVFDTLRILDATLLGIEVNTSGTVNIQPRGIVEIEADNGDNPQFGVENRGEFNILRNLVSQRGRLVIRHVEDTGFDNLGSIAEVTIEGILLISNFEDGGATIQTAISNEDDAIFDIQSSGRVTIDMNGPTSSTTGILNSSSTLLNEGKIEITGTQTNGIHNLGLSQVFNGGSIDINQFAAIGIQNATTASFKNCGTVDIQCSSAPSAVGIWTNADFENDTAGVIKVSKLMDASATGLINIDSVFNDGQIHIFNTSGIGLRNSGATAFLANTNLINIDSGIFVGLDLMNGAKLENEDTISISRYLTTGVRVNSAAHLTNQKEIGVSLSIGATATGLNINTGGTLINAMNGKIRFKDLGGHRGINMNSAFMINQGKILVEQSSVNISFLEITDSELDIEAGADISIGEP